MCSTKLVLIPVLFVDTVPYRSQSHSTPLPSLNPTGSKLQVKDPRRDLANFINFYGRATGSCVKFTWFRVRNSPV